MWHTANVARRNEVFGVVSHELRTPLVTILGCGELLEDDPMSAADVARYAKRIRIAGEALRDVVDDLIEFTMLSMAERDVLVRTVSLSAFWKGAAARCAALDAPDVSVDWQSAVPELLVDIDPAKVTRALWHVVGNAVKFTNGGTVYVRAGLERGLLTMTVEDPGIGIDACHLERIFEPFWQVDSSLVRRHGGTGLGLYLARRSLQQVGGAIGVTSRLGAGSTFVLTVPYGRGARPIRADTITRRPVRGLPNGSRPVGGIVPFPPADLPRCDERASRRHEAGHRVPCRDPYGTHAARF